LAHAASLPPFPELRMPRVRRDGTGCRAFIPNPAVRLRSALVGRGSGVDRAAGRQGDSLHVGVLAQSLGADLASEARFLASAERQGEVERVAVDAERAHVDT